MKTIIIEDNNPQARQLLKYIKTLPYATVMDDPQVAEAPEPMKRKKGFLRAAKACNAVTVDTFIGELRRQIDEHFDKNA